MCIPFIVTRQLLSKHIPLEINTQQWNNCWERRFLNGPCRTKGGSLGFCVFRHRTKQQLGKDVPATT
jgi:hypothetical protein